MPTLRVEEVGSGYYFWTFHTGSVAGGTDLMGPLTVLTASAQTASVPTVRFLLILLPTKNRQKQMFLNPGLLINRLKQACKPVRPIKLANAS